MLDCRFLHPSSTHLPYFVMPASLPGQSKDGDVKIFLNLSDHAAQTTTSNGTHRPAPLSLDRPLTGVNPPRNRADNRQFQVPALPCALPAPTSSSHRRHPRHPCHRLQKRVPSSSSIPVCRVPAPSSWTPNPGSRPLQNPKPASHELKLRGWACFLTRSGPVA